MNDYEFSDTAELALKAVKGLKEKYLRNYIQTITRKKFTRYIDKTGTGQSGY